MGLFLITLAITYLLSVVSAVVDRRALAVQVWSLGPAAADIVARGWNGKAFGSTYLQHLTALSGQVAAIAGRHLAYPVLHTFHSPGRETCAPLALAELDDAVQVLVSGVAPGARPEPSAPLAVRHAIDHFTTTAPRRRGSPAKVWPHRFASTTCAARGFR